MRGGKKDPIDEGFLIPRVAALLVLGKSTSEIADTLSVSFNTVKKIAVMDATKSMVRDMGESVLSVAKSVIRKRTADMTELACEVLLEHLKKERSLDAVKLVYKVAGVLADEPVQKNQGSGAITVVLPGAQLTQESVIDVTGGQVDVQPGEQNGDDHEERGV